MKFNEYINHNIDIENAYQNFKKAKDIDFKRDINKNENKRKIYSFKMFKLSLSIFILLISISIISLSFFIKPRYQEVETDENFNLYCSLLYGNPQNYYEDCMYSNDSFVNPCCGLLKAKVTGNHYFLAGYVNQEKEIIEIKWFKFDNEKIPYAISEYHIKFVMRAYEVQYTEDITTGYCFDYRREYYSACKFEKENPDNKKYIKIIGDVQEFYNYMNNEYLERFHNIKIFNEEDLIKLEQKNTEINKFTHYWKLYEYSYHKANSLYYNIVTINNKEYMQLHLYKIENGEKVKIDFFDSWGILGEKLQKIKEQEIYSEDKNYIFGLYPLDEVKKIIFNSES